MAWAVGSNARFFACISVGYEDGPICGAAVIRVRAGLLGALLLVPLLACRAQAPPGVQLSDVIDAAARGLIASGEASSTIEFRASAEPPWFVLLIPKSTFDADAAKAAGIDEPTRRRIEESSHFWRQKGRGTVVVATGGRRWLGGLGTFTEVDVIRQQIVRGTSAEIAVKLSLSRVDRHVLIGEIVAP
jgi:hypothetical protein